MTWSHFIKNTYINTDLDFTLDYSLMGADSTFFEEMEPRMQLAFSAMRALEDGSIANPDENRMVGHYWLRDPEKAPEHQITTEIEDCLKSIEEFSGKVHRGEIKGSGGNYEHLLVIGIGGSALGPELIALCIEPGVKEFATITTTL